MGRSWTGFFITAGQSRQQLPVMKSEAISRKVYTRVSGTEHSTGDFPDMETEDSPRRATRPYLLPERLYRCQGSLRDQAYRWARSAR